MDAPNLARLSALDGLQGKIAPVHPDFAAARAAVPDGIGWLASQSLSRTRGAADVLGSPNHGLTWFAITA